MNMSKLIICFDIFYFVKTIFYICFKLKTLQLNQLQIKTRHFHRSANGERTILLLN